MHCNSTKSGHKYSKCINWFIFDSPGASLRLKLGGKVVPNFIISLLAVSPKSMAKIKNKINIMFRGCFLRNSFSGQMSFLKSNRRLIYVQEEHSYTCENFYANWHFTRKIKILCIYQLLHKIYKTFKKIRDQHLNKTNHLCKDIFKRLKR